MKATTDTPHILVHAKGTLDLSVPQVMGILNVTPDSFYDGGCYDAPDAALARAEEMVADGAAIIDVGGESTRPGSEAVPPEIQLQRVLPVIEGLVGLAGLSKIPISIDTTSSEVAAAALQAGAAIVNDITGLRGDPNMASVVAEAGAGCIVMHMQGTPQTMQESPDYEDVVGEVCRYLEESVEIAYSAGVSPDRIVTDPGFGFGKRLEDNLTLLHRLDEVVALGYPVLVGPSRKSFIGTITGRPPEERLAGTLAACALAVDRGARIVRVHDVREARDAVLIAHRTSLTG